MLWGERVTRRRLLVGLLVAFAMVDVSLALAVVRLDDRAGATPVAQPLHPLVGEFRPDGTQLAGCVDAACFQQAFGNIAYDRGPKAALDLVHEFYGDGSDSACHRILHFVGAASLARFGGNVAQALAAGAPTCWSGYYHGVLERSLVEARALRPDRLAEVARPLCTGSGLTQWVIYGCLHGLGHGLMIATGLNLPISLEVCSRLGRWWDRDACRGGAFMENIQTSYGFASSYLRDDDPIYPCNWVPRGEKKRCYQTVTSRILPFVGDDWERTAEICARVESGFDGWCFRSLGRDVSSRTNRDPAKIAELCEIARVHGGEGYCIEAAASDVAANFVSGERARAVCEAVHSGVRAQCYYGIGIIIGRFRMSNDARVADCNALVGVPQYVDACIRGGRENLPSARPAR